MVKKGATVSKDPIERLNERIDALEKKLEEKDKKDKDSKNDKDTVQKVADSLSDATDKSLKETSRVLSSLIDSFVEGVNETADALSTISEETDTEKLGRIPGAMVSVFRKGIDIQKKALEKFEESYEEHKKD